MAMDLLRLVAFDAEDLAVISAHLQDAALRVGDLTYLPNEHCFALVARRFDWESSPDEQPRRRLVGLHFDRVQRVRCRGIDRNDRDATLNLIGVTFAETDPPSGTATLLFEDGAAIQLELECIEAQMKDLGPVFTCDKRPTHDADVESA
jgi:hypothetical protein